MLLSTCAAGMDINDPTKPIYSENSESSILTKPVIQEKKIFLLQSLFLSDKKRIAIVNGKMLREGEEGNELFIESIGKNYAIVKYNNNSIKLFLSKKVYLDKLTGEVSD